MFNSKVLNMLSPINEALVGLGVPELLNNHLFEPMGRSTEFYGEFIAYKTGSIPMELRVSESDIEIALAGISEVFIWTAENLNQDRNEVVTFFRRLLSSRLVVDSWGQSYIRYYLLDDNGNNIDRYSTLRLFNAILPHRREEYLPLISLGTSNSPRVS